LQNIFVILPQFAPLFFSTQGVVKTNSLTKDILRHLLLPALSMLMIPSCGLAVSKYAERQINNDFRSNVLANIRNSRELSAQQKDEEIAFFETHSLTDLCGQTDPETEQLRNNACSAGSETWQFINAEKLSWVALLIGILALLCAISLAALAHAKPHLQYSALQWGWRTLTFTSAFEMLAQGIIATWASYWITVLAFNKYVPKLILMVAIVAAYAVFSAIRGIFRKIENASEVDGEVVAESDAAVFKSNLKNLASLVGTEPPASIVAGIDDNFFVTESPLRLGETTLTGRTLFVSLPLLRVMESSEANAVLAHELAHFKGGDTAKSARLGPLLVRYGRYLHDLREGAALPAFYVMNLFQVLFDLAIKKESRVRELRADALAAQVTSPKDIASSLLKVAAYSSHRNVIEKQLFDGMAKHTQALSIQDKVRAGLQSHVTSVGFTEFLKSANTPHPFDSHPPLMERLAEVKQMPQPESLFAEAPQKTWIEALPSSDAIEQRLWTAYENRFNAAHELSLAYRYLPSNDEERVLVEKHFPKKTFQSKKENLGWRMSYLGLESFGGEQIFFRDVASAQVDDSTFSAGLTVVFKSGQKTKVKFNEIGDAKAVEEFKQLFANYWQRDSSAQAT
jgi:Zn-dependent protease with chaperone function